MYVIGWIILSTLCRASCPEWIICSFCLLLFTFYIYKSCECSLWDTAILDITNKYKRWVLLSTQSLMSNIYWRLCLTIAEGNSQLFVRATSALALGYYCILTRDSWVAGRPTFYNKYNFWAPVNTPQTILVGVVIFCWCQNITTPTKTIKVFFTCDLNLMTKLPT